MFVNPFLEAENAKEAILQKHVKMIDTKDAIIINGNNKKYISYFPFQNACRDAASTGLIVVDYPFVYL